MRNMGTGFVVLLHHSLLDLFLMCLMMLNTTLLEQTATAARVSSTGGGEPSQPTTTTTTTAISSPPKPKTPPKRSLVCDAAGTCSRDAAAGAPLAGASLRRCIAACRRPQVASTRRRVAWRSPSCASWDCRSPSGGADHVTTP